MATPEWAGDDGGFERGKCPPKSDGPCAPTIPREDLFVSEEHLRAAEASAGVSLTIYVDPGEHAKRKASGRTTRGAAADNDTDALGEPKMKAVQVGDRIVLRDGRFFGEDGIERVIRARHSAEDQAMIDAAHEAGEAARAALWAAGHSIHYRRDDGALVEETATHEIYAVLVGPDGHTLRGERLL